MKKQVLSAILFVGVVLTMLTGCTATNRSMRQPSALMQWEKSDFTYSPQVSAEASSTRILMIDWARLLKKETGDAGVLSLPVIGSLLNDPTSSYAMYKLMNDNPGYDVIFYPQYEVKHSFPGPLAFIYQKTTAKVTARLAKIN